MTHQCQRCIVCTINFNGLVVSNKAHSRVDKLLFFSDFLNS